MTLTKGSSAKFIELDQHDVVRRFVLPEMQGLEGRLTNFLKKYPNISLVRVGNAIVASEDGATEFKDGLEGAPSAVNGSYMIDLCGGHPVLQQGPARYSEELIAALAHENIIPTEPVAEDGQASIYDFTSEQVDTPAPELPKPDLAAALKAQMDKKEEEKTLSLQEQLNAKLNAKKDEPAPAKSELQIVRTEGAAHVEVKQDYSKSFPHLNEKEEPGLSKTQKDLNKAIEEARKKRETETKSSRAEIKIMEPRPLGKIDILLDKVSRIENILFDGLIPENGEGITGEELAEWFYQHLDTIGHEKTFDILASRLKEEA
jgi:hypothetical protein